MREGERRREKAREGEDWGEYGNQLGSSVFFLGLPRTEFLVDHRKMMINLDVLIVLLAVQFTIQLASPEPSNSSDSSNSPNSSNSKQLPLLTPR